MSPKKPAKSVRFDVNARAFAEVMTAYRDAQGSSLGCVRFGSGKGPTMRDPALPNLTEFRADVERAIMQVVKTDEQAQWFQAAYVWFDSTDEIERGAFAEKLLGCDRHRRWEQRVGAKFVELGIYPARVYMDHLRTK
jgi:hypothetical protein